MGQMSLSAFDYAHTKKIGSWIWPMDV